MSGRFSLVRVYKMAAGGMFGGFLTFLILNPSVRRHELEGPTARMPGDAISNALTHALTVGLVVGITVGALLILVEEWETRSPGRIARMTLTGVAAGALCGMIGAVAAQLVFSTLGLFGSLVVARTVGWSIMGAGAGVCPGIASRSGRRALQGAIGGVIGGGIGGVFFDLLAAITSTGDVSRALGFTVMGAAIGAAVGLVEEFAKEYWLTVLTGAKEGRSYILSRSEMVIGRDERADIPLFGDSSVQRAHARVVSSGGAVSILTEAGAAIMLNSQPVSGGGLSDGDIITLGKHRLRFGARRATAPVVLQPQTPATMMQAISGPHAGQTFRLGPATVMVLGRLPECDIPLANDGQVSRQHARLVWDGADWRIEDSGSTNGLYVNRRRITSSPIHPGDEIAVGQTILRVL